MPRHSSFQIFSDTNTKVVSAYSEKQALVDEDKAKKHVGGGFVSNKVVTERVENVKGSTAGAGSTEFHKYLNAKKREQFRLETIELQDKEAEEKRVLQEKIEKNKLEADMRVKKNAEKRKRKKDKAKQRKLQKKDQQEKESRSDEDSNVSEGDT